MLPKLWQHCEKNKQAAKLKTMMGENNEAEIAVQALLKIVRNPANEPIDEAAALEHLKTLRQLCTRGAQYQNIIAFDAQLNEYLHELLFGGLEVQDQRLNVVGWQLLANAMVQNVDAQRRIWQCHGARLIEQCSLPPLGRITEIKLSWLYNVYCSGLHLVSAEQTLQVVVSVWQAIVSSKCYAKFEFLHIFFERFLVHEGRTTVRCYAQLPSEQRISLLDYMVNYLRQESPNGNVHNFLLQYLSKEFKMKSDCILRTAKEPSADLCQPREVYALLRVIACASGSELYTASYVNDHALFLNVSSLLRALNALGKEDTPNMFTPKSKLEEVTPNSSISREFESDLSYELKTLLVRCIANLLYKNKTNQGYCLDTQLLPALFESTNIDGRNPLLKEWSILAIRNACDGCPEVQSVIANMTKQGDAPNEMLKELNLEMGALRIQPNKE